jgi:hypothetical protein
MYIDCDSHYFPVKFLEGVCAKFPNSPRVVRNGDDVRSVLPDGTLIKNQAPKGRWHLDTRDQFSDSVRLTNPGVQVASKSGAESHRSKNPTLYMHNR